MYIFYYIIIRLDLVDLYLDGWSCKIVYLSYYYNYIIIRLDLVDLYLEAWMVGPVKLSVYHHHLTNQPQSHNNPSKLKNSRKWLNMILVKHFTIQISICWNTKNIFNKTYVHTNLQNSTRYDILLQNHAQKHIRCTFISLIIVSYHEIFSLK